MDKNEWNKYVKVFNLDVDVTVKKEVTKQDVILSLLDEGEVAFKGFRGEQFIMKINNKFNLELLEQIIWTPVKEYLEKSKEKEGGR